MIAHPGHEAVHVVHLCTGATVGHAVLLLFEHVVSLARKQKEVYANDDKEQTTIDIYGIEKILGRMLKQDLDRWGDG